MRAVNLSRSLAGASSNRIAGLAFPCDGYTIAGNNTRQGYARKRILKPAGFYFLGSSQGSIP